MEDVVIIEDSDEDDASQKMPDDSTADAVPQPAHANLGHTRSDIPPSCKSQELEEASNAAKRSEPMDPFQEQLAEYRSGKRRALEAKRPEAEEMSDQANKGVIDLEETEQRKTSNQTASASGQRSLCEEYISRSRAWVAPFQLLRAKGIPDYANRPPTGIRLRDVVKGDMKWVLVSNYMVDLGWLLSSCVDVRRAGFVQLVHGESHPTMLKLMREEAKLVGLIEGKNFCLHAPPLPIPYGTHHSKAFLVEYSMGIRVVIHTANLVHCDNNFKTQGLWVQDFPLKDAASPPSSPFENDLLDYLSSLQVPVVAGQTSVVARCRQFDFSSARVHLIASRPGRHTGGQQGHLGLKSKLSKEAFSMDFKATPVFAQFSSLGSLDAKWLHQEFQHSLSAGLCVSSQGLSKSPIGSGPSNNCGLQLVWPTVEEVRNSLEGWAAGRSIPGFEKNVKKPFLQTLWHRFGGEPVSRQRAMPHIKTFGRYLHVPGKGTKLAWFLLTSHNLSKAAWGALQSGGQVLMIRSYEMGVLFLPSLEAAYRAHRHCGFSCSERSPVNLPQGQQAATIEFWTRKIPSDAPEESNKLYFPLPYRLPPKLYDGDDHPWMADHAYGGVDAYGRKRDDPDSSPPMYGFTEDS